MTICWGGRLQHSQRSPQTPIYAALKLAAIYGAPAVAVAAAPTLDTVVAVVAALASGVPVVPVPIDSGPDERAHILRDSGAACFLGEHPWDDVRLGTVPLSGAPHARASATFLTGVHPRKTAGADIKAGVSADQIAAKIKTKLIV